jgi:hypothetical protein
MVPVHESLFHIQYVQVRCQSDVFPCAVVKCLSERSLRSSELEPAGGVVERFGTRFAR